LLLVAGFQLGRLLPGVARLIQGPGHLLLPSPDHVPQGAEEHVVEGHQDDSHVDQLKQKGPQVEAEGVDRLALSRGVDHEGPVEHGSLPLSLLPSRQGRAAGTAGGPTRQPLPPHQTLVQMRMATIMAKRVKASMNASATRSVERMS